MYTAMHDLTAAGDLSRPQIARGLLQHAYVALLVAVLVVQ